jgi:pre-mRNA-splicing factor ATP-dependent RNA helicase DHX15/PRP43
MENKNIINNDNIGILDPQGLNLNPLTDKPYSDKYKELAKKWSQFPAYESAVDIINTIKLNQVILVISGTGSGKTVLIPKYALHSTDYKGKIAVTLPKQIIAKSAAEFAAATLDVEIGNQIGYKFKGSEPKDAGKNPLLLYATDGTIVAKLISDSEIKDLDMVIIDEAHERKIQIDFLFYLLKKVLDKRPEFKLIIMSATIDSALFRSYFSEYKYTEINVGGKTNFPIESKFSSNKADPELYIDRGIKIIEEIEDRYRPSKDSKIEDILFFVCSKNETEEVKSQLIMKYPQYEIISVYSGISSEQQNMIQNKDKNDRRILISTNVAESSLTVDGIKFVIDSGFEIFSYDEVKTGAKVIDKQLITKAQAMQRMGRAGRTQPGICYHLYTIDEFENKMKKFPEPSIKTIDITSECLKLLQESSIKTISTLRKILSEFIEPPKNEYIKMAINNLIDYRTLKNCKTKNEIECTLNEYGKILGKLQLELNQGLTMLMAYKLNILNEVYNIILLLNEIKFNLDELFIVPEENPSLYKKFKQQKNDLSSKYGDIITVYKIIERYRLYEKDSSKSDFCYKYFIKKNILDKVLNSFKKNIYKFKANFKEFEENINKIDGEINIVDGEINIVDGEINKIIMSFLFGYRYNIIVKGKNRDNLYVDIARDSVLVDAKNSTFFYIQLFKIGGNYQAQIVSAIPQKLSQNYIKILSI